MRTENVSGRASTKIQRRMQCEVCVDAVAKYKCPTCALRYCSVPCFKTHRETKTCAAVAAAQPETKKRKVVAVDVSSSTPAAARVPSLAGSGPIPEQDPHGDEGEDELGVRMPDAALAVMRSSESLAHKLRDERLQKVLAQHQTLVTVRRSVWTHLRARLSGTAVPDMVVRWLSIWLLVQSRAQVIGQIDSAADRPAALEAAKATDKDFAAFIDEMLVTVGVCARTADGAVQFVGVPRP